MQPQPAKINIMILVKVILIDVPWGREEPELE